MQLSIIAKALVTATDKNCELVNSAPDRHVSHQSIEAIDRIGLHPDGGSHGIRDISNNSGESYDHIWIMAYSQGYFLRVTVGNAATSSLFIFKMIISISARSISVTGIVIIDTLIR